MRGETRSSVGAWVAFGAALLLGGCGLLKYPGQPGMVTNGYSKIDMEVLDAAGLFVYEASYDNREGGKGVGALVTKLHPGAQTFTASVRTNADGTFYRAKGQYLGAQVQMISLPQTGQIMMPPDSKVMLFLEYDVSLSEIDDKNVAEQALFSGPGGNIAQLASPALRRRWEWLNAGRFGEDGMLSYGIERIELGEHAFVPPQELSLRTSLSHSAVRLSASRETGEAFVKFLESTYPTGFKGDVRFHLRGAASPLVVPLGVHSVGTAKASGIQILEGSSAPATVVGKR